MKTTKRRFKLLSAEKSSTMRHAAKTHRVNLAWLSEIVNKALCTIMYVQSERQAADIFTKGFDKPKLYAYLRLLIGVHDPHDCPDLILS